MHVAAVGVTNDVMTEQLNAFAVTSDNVQVVRSFEDLAGTVDVIVSAMLAVCGRGALSYVHHGINPLGGHHCCGTVC